MPTPPPAQPPAQPAIQPATQIVIADDHPLVREALAQTLRQVLGQPAIHQAGSLDEAARLLDGVADGADLVLLDLDMPGMDGFTGLAALRGRHPLVPVAIVSAAREPGVMRKAIDFGACAFIPKSAPVDIIGAALEAVLAGEVWLPPEAETSAPAQATPAANDLARRVAELTPQQLKVLAMMRKGLLNKQIAYELSVGEATVKAHVTQILRKLGVVSRTQAVIAARGLQIDS